MENNNFEPQTNGQQFTDNNANPQFQQPYQQAPYQQPYQQPYYQQPPVVDQKSTGLNILSFFIPLVGLILYLTMKDQTPIKAKGCGKAALIGFILGIVASFVLPFVFTLLFAGVAGGVM